MNVLGIETSCDETGVAIVNEKGEILSHILRTQLNEHQRFGGVVPELASRSHVQYLHKIVDKAMREAGLGYSELDAIAATTGPGLIGGVIVGTMFAKGLSLATNKPFISVNHLEGHALTARLTNDVQFPFLLLLVSGGHCQILFVEGVGKYTLLGATVDDAVGEAFDKVAKMLGLPYPGGPSVEARAKLGDPHSYKFPKPFYHEDNCNFSFSGIKTSVRREIEAIPSLTDQHVNNICASFQYTVGQILTKKIITAIAKINNPNVNQLVIAGGVAANQYLKGVLEEGIASYNYQVIAPPLKLCTDNGVMIAWAGLERFRLNMINDLYVEPKSRWPLMDL